MGGLGGGGQGPGNQPRGPCGTAPRFVCAQGIQHPVGHCWWKGMVGEAREGTPDKTGVGRTKDGGAVTVQRKAPGTVQARTLPASTTKRRLPATDKERALRTRDPRSGGAYVVDGRDNAWRSRARGPHAHGNAARHVVDGLRTEVWGQQKQPNDPYNNQHNPNTPTTGRR